MSEPTQFEQSFYFAMVLYIREKLPNETLASIDSNTIISNNGKRSEITTWKYEFEIPTDEKLRSYSAAQLRAIQREQRRDGRRGNIEFKVMKVMYDRLLMDITGKEFSEFVSDILDGDSENGRIALLKI